MSSIQDFVKTFQLLRDYHKSFATVECVDVCGEKAFLYPCRGFEADQSECSLYKARIYRSNRAVLCDSCSKKVKSVSRREAAKTVLGATFRTAPDSYVKHSALSPESLLKKLDRVVKERKTL
mmetsp:Transcript_25655/g.42702  ORF Transcript_25655/g.42702 Transcript_25655/m.42702 type:complete len:122 (-) Transcript_25655:633-998(-)